MRRGRAIFGPERLRPTQLWNKVLLRGKPGRQGEVRWGPDVLMLFVTRRCDQRCGWCPFHQESRFGPEPGFPDIRLQDYRVILQRLPGASTIGLVGGEPLLHPELPRLIRIARRRRLRVHLATNGLRMDREMARQVIRAGLGSITWSLDATDDESYVRFRRGSDVQFRTVMENLRGFLRIRPPELVVEISRVTSRANLAGSLDFLRLGRRLGVDVVRFQNVIHYDCSPETRADALLEDGPELRSLLDALQRESSDPQVIPPVAVRPTSDTIRCAQPFRTLGIDGAGNLSPCCVILPRRHFGNLLSDPRAFHGEPLRQVRRSMLDGSEPLFDICRTCSENRSGSS